MAPATKSVGTAKSKTVSTKRPVKYAEKRTDMHDELNPITVDMARELLRWNEVEETATDFLLKDLNGNKIICLNNARNRPLYMTNVNDLKQTILTRNWEFNGEPIIIGKYGTVLNGQHTLIALILAEQERVSEDGDKWKQYWKDECSIEKAIVYGVDETDKIVNTMDTCKPRSIADIVYRNPYFSSLTDKGKRRDAARMTENAVKFVWERTGAMNDPNAPRRTHTEALNFLDSHRGLVEAVSFVHEENQEGKVANVLSPGYASGLMYLMAAGETNGEAYWSAKNPSEKQMSLSLFDKAREFWVALCQGDPALQVVRDTIASAKGESGSTDRNDVIAILIAAWNAFVADKPLTKSLFKFHREDKKGKSVIVDPPTCGGIDMGPNPKKKEAEEAEEEQAEADAEVEAKPIKVGKNIAKVQPNKGGKAKATKADATETEEEAPVSKANKGTTKGKGKGSKKVESNGDTEDETKADWKPIKTTAELSKGKTTPATTKGGKKKAAPNNRLSPNAPLEVAEDDEAHQEELKAERRRQGFKLDDAEEEGDTANQEGEEIEVSEDESGMVENVFAGDEEE